MDDWKKEETKRILKGIPTNYDSQCPSIPHDHLGYVRYVLREGILSENETFQLLGVSSVEDLESMLYFKALPRRLCLPPRDQRILERGVERGLYSHQDLESSLDQYRQSIVSRLDQLKRTPSSPIALMDAKDQIEEYGSSHSREYSTHNDAPRLSENEISHLRSGLDVLEYNRLTIELGEFDKWKKGYDQDLNQIKCFMKSRLNYN